MAFRRDFPLVVITLVHPSIKGRLLTGGQCNDLVACSPHLAGMVSHNKTHQEQGQELCTKACIHLRTHSRERWSHECLEEIQPISTGRLLLCSPWCHPLAASSRLCAQKRVYPFSWADLPLGVTNIVWCTLNKYCLISKDFITEHTHSTHQSTYFRESPDSLPVSLHLGDPNYISELLTVNKGGYSWIQLELWALIHCDTVHIQFQDFELLSI